MNVAFFEFRFSSAYKTLLTEGYNRVLKRGVFINGDEVEKLEQEIAEFLNVRNVISVGNGYDALFIALQSISNGQKLKVLLQSNAYLATVNAVINAGHEPVFYDLAYETNHFKSGVEAFAIENKVDVILPIHYFGNVQKLDTKMLNGQIILEDFSQGFASNKDNWVCGAEGEINAASLYPTKNLGALGDAGIISTNDDELADWCRKFRNYGESDYYKINSVGVNSRMDELQAAFARVSLSQIENNREEKVNILNRYRSELSGIPDLKLPEFSEGEFPHQFVIKTSKRDDLMTFLSQNGIQTKIHYPKDIFSQEAYKNFESQNIDLQTLRKWHQSVLSLPFYLGLKEMEQEFVIEKTQEFFN